MRVPISYTTFWCFLNIAIYPLKMWKKSFIPDTGMNSCKLKQSADIPFVIYVNSLG